MTTDDPRRVTVSITLQLNDRDVMEEPFNDPAYLAKYVSDTIQYDLAIKLMFVETRYVVHSRHKEWDVEAHRLISNEEIECPRCHGEGSVYPIGPDYPHQCNWCGGTRKVVKGVLED